MVSEKLDKVLKRKEKFLSENPEYQKQENLFHRHSAGKYIGDLIYGANDGVITTFAVVAGAAGASLPGTVIIILGFANLLADGLSMGASAFLGSKSESDYANAQREKENWEIENLKELEIAEIKEIFQQKGFKGKDLERTVEIITSNKKVWVDTMMREELNIFEEDGQDPLKHGVATFGAFLLAGFLPLIPFLVPVENNFILASLVGAITLFIVGSLRSIVTTVSWWRGGFEMLFIGSIAASVAYFVGSFIEKLVSR